MFYVFLLLHICLLPLCAVCYLNSFNLCSGLKSFENAERKHFHLILFFFYSYGGYHNPNVFRWILFHNVCTYCKCVWVLGMVSAGVYIVERACLCFNVCCCTIGGDSSTHVCNFVIGRPSNTTNVIFIFPQNIL